MALKLVAWPRTSTLLRSLCIRWGNIRVILGLYGNNGKENGNYHNGLYRV